MAKSLSLSSMIFWGSVLILGFLVLGGLTLKEGFADYCRDYYYKIPKTNTCTKITGSCENAVPSSSYSNSGCTTPGYINRYVCPSTTTCPSSTSSKR